MLRQENITILGVNTKTHRGRKNLSFKQQANYLIEDLMGKIKDIKNSDLIIIVLHEYALYDNASKIVNHEEKAYFQNKINEIVKNFNNVVIIAGTILYSKKIGDKLPKLIQRYEESTDYVGSAQHYKDEFNKLQNQGTLTKYTRNICYAASSPDFLIAKSEDEKAKDEKANHWHRDKVIPYFDSVNEKIKADADTIFKPGHLPNLFFITNLASITNLSCVVEICMEHSSSFIKDLYEKQKISRPLFHFVVSSPANSIKNNFIGKYNIHVDAGSGTTVFVNDSIEVKDSEITLEIFSYEACVPGAKLKPVNIQKLVQSDNKLEESNNKKEPVNDVLLSSYSSLFSPLPPPPSTSSPTMPPSSTTPPPLPPSSSTTPPPLPPFMRIDRNKKQ